MRFNVSEGSSGFVTRPVAFLGCLVLSSAFMIACVDSSTVSSPIGAEQFNPPPIYEVWWSMIEECSGRTEALGTVSWYVLRGATSIPSIGENVGAYWQQAGNRITLTGETRLAGPTVRHEMLHALTRAPGHPRRYFLEHCGGLVDCTGECIADAGAPPPVPRDALLVPPESLQVSLQVFPRRPRIDTLDGFFTVTVEAKNSSSHPILMTPLLPSGSRPMSTFGLIFNPGTSEFSYFDHAWDPEVTLFLPGEIKREVFDLRTGDSSLTGALAPGSYLLQGGYGTHLTSPTELIVSGSIAKPSGQTLHLEN